jgi:hypothetical protein
MSKITEQEIEQMADKIILVISNNTKENIKESIVNGINYLLNKATLQNKVSAKEVLDSVDDKGFLKSFYCRNTCKYFRLKP